MPQYKLTNGSKRQLTIRHSGDCDLCGSRQNTVISDAAVLYSGRRVWAWVCPACFTAHQGRLGIGRGQEYTLTAEPTTEPTD